MIVRFSPRPVTVAPIPLYTQFVSFGVLVAVQKRFTAVTLPAPVMAPLAAVSVTLPGVSDVMLPSIVRLPLKAVVPTTSVMASLATTLVPVAINRSSVSLTVRDWPAPVIFATSDCTVVFSALVLRAVTFSTLPETWPSAALSVMLPLLAFSVTLPVPARMLPEPIRLPVARLIDTSPLFVATSDPTISRALASFTIRF